MKSTRAILQGAAYYGNTPLSSASYAISLWPASRRVAAAACCHAASRCVCIPNNCQLQELLALLACSLAPHARALQAASTAGSYKQGV
jgi:hypothetical protein